MWFFKKKAVDTKKNQAQLNKEDKALIDSNSSAVNALIILSDNKEFGAKLLKLQEELKFLTPSADSKIFAFDQQIQTLIGELKAVLTEDGSAGSKAESAFRDIRIAIADRNSVL